ncbi:GNAT family N-acetyltransferase [Nocardioides anomalus]|uniref:GNAT family N-acetyltransferase n=1 Tax=Nocardioides anomalus TaxID=2712223 RepID=A0A6G6WDD6_9ACTN|nr:GNAT family protein [Nocardioides anomalus]QIG43163.1 GNAT family N-acetyltransferase [Nocardioides anomalus]
MSTPRARVVHLSPEVLAALAGGDVAAAEVLLGRPLPAYLVSPERLGVWRRRATQVVETPEDQPWVTGLLVDEDSGEVVGAAGFHGAPDADGMVEVGYGVDPTHRRRGYARAALLHLLERARAHPDVHTLRATVSPSNTASLGLIAQLPFVEVGEQWDEEDGLETVYELDVRRAAT